MGRLHRLELARERRDPGRLRLDLRRQRLGALLQRLALAGREGLLLAQHRHRRLRLAPGLGQALVQRIQFGAAGGLGARQRRLALAQRSGLGGPIPAFPGLDLGLQRRHLAGGLAPALAAADPEAGGSGQQDEQQACHGRSSIVGGTRGARIIPVPRRCRGPTLGGLRGRHHSHRPTPRDAAAPCRNSRHPGRCAGLTRSAPSSAARPGRPSSRDRPASRSWAAGARPRRVPPAPSWRSARNARRPAHAARPR